MNHNPEISGTAPATTHAIWSGVGTLQQPPLDPLGAAIREREGAAAVEIGLCGRSAPVGAGMAESSPKGPSSPAKIVEEKARNTEQLQRFSN